MSLRAHRLRRGADKNLRAQPSVVCSVMQWNSAAGDKGADRQSATEESGKECSGLKSSPGGATTAGATAPSACDEPSGAPQPESLRPG